MTALQAGDLFANRFEIHRSAGSGGMGTVYCARDRYTAELVALKLLHDSTESAVAADSDRFGREARLLAELRHPGIVSYIAHGQTPEGQRFLVMEWLDGEDLSRRLSRGPLELTAALELFTAIAEALAVAHLRGVIHRDLKPNNIFLPRGDLKSAKLLDFGIARRLETSRLMTRTGVVIGTPAYMAPEQARGQKDLAAAADIFSLGCMLYECLTGDPPFTGEHVAAVLARVLFEDPLPLSSRRPGVAKAVEELLGHMLAKDPNRRIPDAGALLARLRLLDGVPEIPNLPTIAAPPMPASTFAESQQHLSSLVIALLSQEEKLAGQTVLLEDERQKIERRGSLLAALRLLGARAELLPSGALMVTVPQAGSAIDQAIAAARAALLIKEHIANAEVAVATGRAVAHGPTDGGEVADRAVGLLKQRTERRSADPIPSGVYLDALSARLLGPRFIITMSDAGPLLLREEKDVDTSRPLLGKPTPCVGREAELGTLESQLAGCIEESEARAVLITAAPGFGKSRLRHEFLRRALQRNQTLTVMQGMGELTSAGAPYAIIGQAVRKLCEISGGEPLEIKRKRLRAHVELHIAIADRDRVVLFLGELLGLPDGMSEPPMLRAAREDPRIMRDQVRRAFVDFLAALCKVTPVLFLLDDLQWSDPLSIGLVDAALDELRGAPLFVVALSRPELDEQFPRLFAKHKLLKLPLSGLSIKACERLVRQVLGDKLPPVKVMQLIEQAAGNALYLEELIRAAAEGNIEDHPETVLAMLQARIGRFAKTPRRAVLAASVFGQSFFRGGVATLLGQSQDSRELDDALRILCEAEVIQASATSRLPADKEYGFRHALVRDAAYGLLSAADLATGHRLAAVFLEAAGESDSALIAEHYERGGDRMQAGKLYFRAAVRLYERQEQQGALRCAERALSMGIDGCERAVLQALKTIVAFWQEELAACIQLAPDAIVSLTPGSPWWCRAVSAGIMAAGQSGDEACLAFCAQALVKAEPQPDAKVPYAEALAYLANVCCITGQAERMVALHARLESLVPDGAGAEPMCLGFKNLSLCFCGFLSEKDPYLPAEWARRSSVAFRESGSLRDGVGTHTFLGMTLAGLGSVEDAERELRYGYDQAQRMNQPFLSDFTRIHLALFLSGCDRRDWQQEAAALAHAQLSAPGSNSLHVAMAQGVLARVAAKREDYEAALTAARHAYETLRFFPAYWFFVAPCELSSLLKLNRMDEACVRAAELQAALLRTRSGGINDIAVRLGCAEALAAAGRTPEAQAILRAARVELEARAARIPDPEQRKRYLSLVPENACVMACARPEIAFESEPRR